MQLKNPLASPKPPRRLLGQPEAQDLAASRLPWLLGGILLWALCIQGRLIQLQVVQRKQYQARADRQHLVELPIPPVRGDLRDRQGGSLAISLKVESLFCTPHSFYPDYRMAKGGERVWGEPDRPAAQKAAEQLSSILGLPTKAVLAKLLRKSPFVWLERQMAPTKVEQVRALNLECLDFIQESRRYYPRGSLACQILGFTDIDGNGMLGIERTWNRELAGRPGALLAPKDAHNRLLLLQENYKEIPVNGSTLQLTIDATIQHIVEEVLAEGVQLAKPTTAYAVVVDPGTGEILAMAGTPTFNPNQVLPRHLQNRSESQMTAAEKEELQRELERQKAARKVHPLEDSYEPGSTMKIFTAAIALEERKVYLGEKIDCMGGRWQYSPKVPPITDTHRCGVLSFEEVLWQSSNVGAAKIGTRLEPAVHYQYLRKFGFGETTGLNFPGESAGRLIAPDRWTVPTQYTLSYGYGLSVTPLQILMAGCALANGGKLMKPILVKRVFNDQGVMLQEFAPMVRHQVISEETSRDMRETLKGVITQGTARKAQLEGGVEAFGKTGTARKIIGGKYDPRRHYASFLGFFPADKPQYGMLFMLDDPAGDATGGDVAAPLFKKIGDRILRYRATERSGQAQEPDLKLSLRDWPASETDEASVHVEVGKVPQLMGLTLKAAIQRVVLAGGQPKVEGLEAPAGITPGRPITVVEQRPAAGAALARGAIVHLILRTP